MKKFSALLAAALLLAPQAQAATFSFGGTDWSTNANTSTLQLQAAPDLPNQPQNIQCIICGTNQPQQAATFGYNNYKQGGNITTFLSSSTSQLGGVQLNNNTLGIPYTVGFLAAFLGSQIDLDIGIDVNTAQGQGPEVLNAFAVLDTGNNTILALYTGPTNLAPVHNGSGFPDYLLTGFDLNRLDINAATNLLFFASWQNGSDGAESFFLVPTASPNEVPLPGALVLMASALMGAVGVRRLRRRKLA